MGAFFSFVWWALLDPLNEEDFTSQLVIPDGTSEVLAAGGKAPFIPDRINVAPGGQLLVINRDSTEHRVGGFKIPAGSEALISPETEGGELSCSIHPSGALGLGPAGRPPFVLMALPTALIGLPVGLVVWLVTMIASRLDTDPPVPDGPA